MRRQEPDHPRPFKLPAGEVLALAAFIVANLVIAFVLLAIDHVVNPSELTPSMDWRGGSWLWPYLAGMAVLSYLGPEDFGGIGDIPFGWDILVMAVFSIAIYYLTMSVRLSPEEVRRHVADAREEVEATDEELAV